MLELGRRTIEAFDKIDHGPHPGFRPAHAKGVLLAGEFKPAPEAAHLTRAPHIQQDFVPVTVRVSNFAGVPTVADNEPQSASPRGFAVRFHLAEQRLLKEPVKFRIQVQVAEDGDVTDDVTVRWPESRKLVNFGEITLKAVAHNNAAEQQQIIFDPIPRVDGIEASADPLFEPRANIYLISGRRRREAGKSPTP